MICVFDVSKIPVMFWLFFPVERSLLCSCWLFSLLLPPLPCLNLLYVSHIISANLQCKQLVLQGRGSIRKIIVYSFGQKNVQRSTSESLFPFWWYHLPGLNGHFSWAVSLSFPLSGLALWSFTWPCGHLGPEQEQMGDFGWVSAFYTCWHLILVIVASLFSSISVFACLVSHYVVLQLLFLFACRVFTLWCFCSSKRTITKYGLLSSMSSSLFPYTACWCMNKM